MTSFLRITRRQRQSYVSTRQRRLLSRILELLEVHGTDWHRAELLAEAVSTYYRGPWKAHRDLTEPAPGWSATTRALWELWRLSKPPTTARGIFDALKATPSPTSVDRNPLAALNADMAHGDPHMFGPDDREQYRTGREAWANTPKARPARIAAAPAARQEPAPAPRPQDTVEARARAEFARDAKLRDEFGNDVDSFIAYRIAETAGRIRRG